MPRKTIMAQKPPRRFRAATPPREEEGDLEVEQDEEDGHEVVAHVELHPRVFEGFEAAFVRGVLRLSGGVGRAEAETWGATPTATPPR
jgi:hypothetical protein